MAMKTMKTIELKNVLDTIATLHREQMLSNSRNNLSSYLSSIESYKSSIEGFKTSLKREEETIKSIEDTKPENTMDSLSRIKKLKFVNGLTIDKDKRYLEIKTKDLILKGNVPDNFNAGPYLIRLRLDGYLKVYRERLKKYGLDVSGYMQHCFSDSSGNVCFGDDYSKFKTEIAFARYDTALTMLWTILSDASPSATAHGMISYSSLINQFGSAELKIIEIEKVKADLIKKKKAEEKLKKEGKAWSIAGMKPPGAEIKTRS